MIIPALGNDCIVSWTTWFASEFYHYVLYSCSDITHRENHHEMQGSIDKSGTWLDLREPVRWHLVTKTTNIEGQLVFIQLKMPGVIANYETVLVNWSGQRKMLLFILKM